MKLDLNLFSAIDWKATKKGGDITARQSENSMFKFKVQITVGLLLHIL